MGKKKKGKEKHAHRHTDQHQHTTDCQPVRKQVEIDLEQLADQLSFCLEVLAQLNEEEAMFFGSRFCIGFGRQLSRGLLGATTAQAKTLHTKLATMGACIAGLAEAVEEQQLVSKAASSNSGVFVAPTTQKAQ